MFGQTTNTRSSFQGPSLISDRTAKRTAQAGYDNELAASQRPRQTILGKGMGAGSGRFRMDDDIRREAGYASAKGAYANSYMDAAEANRQARLQSDAQQAQEASVLAGLMQDLSQMDFIDRYSQASAKQEMEKANIARNRGMASAQTDMALGFLKLLLGN